MNVVLAVTAVLNGLAAALAWAAKLWWGREFAAAKDETIRAKDAQLQVLEREIESLRELTPMKIREYFLSVTQQLEEYNGVLNRQLDEARREAKVKEADIERLKGEGDKRRAEVVRLEGEKKALEAAADKMEGQLGELRAKYESDDVIIWRVPKYDEALFTGLAESSKRLEGQLKSISIVGDAFGKELRNNLMHLSFPLSTSWDDLQKQSTGITMTTRHTCTKCGKTFDVPARGLLSPVGLRSIKCPHCGTDQEVP
ncbi:MAG TPA: hypothetical protein VEV39_03200 [Gemmatimonadales bacterium]|nr:hypothetical protein [Gemmatimonadales bacterium]